MEYSIQQRRQAYHLLLAELIELGDLGLSPEEVNQFFVNSLPWVNNTREAELLHEEIKNTTYAELEDVV